MDERDEILTTAAAARLLGISPITMGKWLCNGCFPNAYRLNPRNPQSHWRVPRGDVNDFLQQRRKEQGYYRMPVMDLVSDR